MFALRRITQCFSVNNNWSNPLFFNAIVIYFFQRESFSEYLPYMAGKNKAGESLESEELKKFLQVCTEHLSSILNRLENTF